ncbi:MAG: nucleotidyltransferase domain-containing protein [Colwellia sp.]
MSFGLSESYIAQINNIFEKFSSINKVILYGSRAKGTYKNGSDIDLTLMGNNITHKDFLNISNQLDDLMTPYQFDLSIYSQINNQELLKHINRVGVVFFTK